MSQHPLIASLHAGDTGKVVSARQAVRLIRDGDIIRTGDCSASTDWKLKLSPENGRVEVEFEVDQDRHGQTWNVRLKRNGSSFWSGQRTTQAPSGSFEVRRVASGSSGDRFAGIATNPRSGEV
ncbi:MAG TPA: hypothetical protein VLQ88_08775, partial [Chromatiaceae bacterium]|nr:hypothetical protein [Chromatiaceae bacterium]